MCTVCLRSLIKCVVCPDSQGKYWCFGDGTAIVCGDSSPVQFLLEFCDLNKMAIRTLRGKYLKGDHAGGLKASADSLESATLWEYWESTAGLLHYASN